MVFDDGYTVYVAPGLVAERDERRLDAPHVEITTWSPVGGWVEGTFGPSAKAPAPSTGRPSAYSSPAGLGSG